MKPSPRIRVRRQPQRGVYERSRIDAILDEGLVCHLGFVEAGQPFVLPTLYVRAGDLVYIHGSAASRMLRGLGPGVPTCLTVTLIDGLVLARSAFHHSANYRSVVVLGQAVEVTDPAEKLVALRTLSERLLPGRWAEVRPPDPRELKATTIHTLPISEASAKLRTGPPTDDEDDYSRPVWAGVIPLRLLALAPEADPRLLPGIAVPPYAIDYLATGRQALAPAPPR